MRPGLAEVLVDEVTPVFKSVEDGLNCVNHVVEYNNPPGSALRVERGRRVEELKLFLEGGLARLGLTEQQELRGD